MVEKSRHFTLRHKMDVKNLINIIGEKYNKKVLYDNEPIYFHEAQKMIDIPRVRKFLEINPEYKV